MRGKILLVVRRLHLYLSVFFAPLLLLFVITGWAQTMDFDHSTPVLERLSNVHTEQFFAMEPRKGRTSAERDAEEAAARPMKWLVAAMSVALIVSIGLGLVLAFTLVRQRVAVWIALLLGIATPVLLLAAAHFR
jgi:hypothetical protein